MLFLASIFLSGSSEHSLPFFPVLLPFENHPKPSKSAEHVLKNQIKLQFIYYLQPAEFFNSFSTMYPMAKCSLIYQITYLRFIPLAYPPKNYFYEFIGALLNYITLDLVIMMPVGSAMKLNIKLVHMFHECSTAAQFYQMPEPKLITLSSSLNLEFNTQMLSNIPVPWAFCKRKVLWIH